MEIVMSFVFIVVVLGWAVWGLLTNDPWPRGENNIPAPTRPAPIPPAPPKEVSFIISLPWADGTCIYDPRYQSHERFIYLWVPDEGEVAAISLDNYIRIHGYTPTMLNEPLVDIQDYKKYQLWLAAHPYGTHPDFPYIRAKAPKYIEHRRSTQQQPISTGRPFINTGRCCLRCGGAGYLPHFSHVQGGVCFRCNGRG